MSDDIKKQSLSDDNVTARRGMARRTFLLGTIGGTAAVSGCVAVPVATTGTGLTDSDSGAWADPVGNGRGRVTVAGITDSDTGAWADPVGRGRGRRACTDSDLGAYADPAGRGRRC